MKWTTTKPTTTKPTEPGWYWVRPQGRPMEMWEFRRGPDGRLTDYEGATVDMYADDCEFDGPIPMPEEP